MKLLNNLLTSYTMFHAEIFPPELMSNMVLMALKDDFSEYIVVPCEFKIVYLLEHGIRLYPINPFAFRTAGLNTVSDRVNSGLLPHQHIGTSI